jgi:EAL domain-containing protein (putative c-di-GMP-specific phosphodiesterase class I)
MCDLLATMMTPLTKWSTVPDQLKLEITKTSLIRHTAQVLIVLKHLRKLGDTARYRRFRDCLFLHELYEAV